MSRNKNDAKKIWSIMKELIGETRFYHGNKTTRDQ